MVSRDLSVLPPPIYLLASWKLFWLLTWVSIQTDDEYESLDTSRWGNKDVYPSKSNSLLYLQPLDLCQSPQIYLILIPNSVPHDKRTYGVYAFASYWYVYTLNYFGEITHLTISRGTCGVCLSSFTIGSSLIGIGLTAGQAMGAIVRCSVEDMSMDTNN